MKDLYLHTPLLRSTGKLLSHAEVYFKMEALQPCGSFKARGISFACQEYKKNGATRFISSSGGNSGLAVAYSGRKLGVPVTVVVPKSTSARPIALIEREGAEVTVRGESWLEAHEYALSLVDSHSAYLHPFDDPLIWRGHSTVVDEIIADGIRPDAVVLSVGGGGLLCGVVEGLRRNGLNTTPVIAMETIGADSYFQSVQAGKRVKLEAITSIAGSLGAKEVAEKAFDYRGVHPIFSHTVTDKDAVAAALKFADEQRVLVEPACGAALAAVYTHNLLLNNFTNIAVIVCGGVNVSIGQLLEWQNKC